MSKLTAKRQVCLLTDNEIIKALECCLNNDWNKTKCNECSFYTGCLGCVDELKKSTIDLINRLKGESNKYFKSNADFVAVVRCKDCIHDLKGYCNHDFALNLNRSDDYCSYGERKEDE